MQLLNGDFLYFDILQNISQSTIKELGWSQTVVKDFDTCFVNNNDYLLVIVDFGFKFNSHKDIMLFVDKIVFFKIESLKRFVFFELIDKDELMAFLSAEPKPIKNVELSKPGIIDIYILKSGNLLSADVYGRSGEFYQNLDDYNIVISDIV